MHNREKNESILSYAQRLLNEENAYELGIVEQYNLLFNEEVSYDNAQRQLKGIKKFLRLIQENKTIEEVDRKIDLTINKDGTQTRNALLELSEDEIKTPSLLLQAHGYNPKLFELVSSKNSMWHQKSNAEGLQTLYASKITVKPRIEISIEDIEEIFNKMNRTYHRPKSNRYETSGKNECLIINFFDVHFSKLSHISETGENYDYKIAQERISYSIDKYINKYKNRKIDQVIFAVGQDYFNSEPTGNTVGNTRQDNDSRYSVMFEKGVESLIECIDKLEETFKCKIIVPLVQGNHSTYTEYYAAQFLKAWYRKDENIQVDADPTPRKYYQFGINLFGFTHNSEEKDRIYYLMQSEAAHMWADTIERTWFTGHLHSEDVKEKCGVYVRQAPTLCGTDAWHKKLGFVNPIKRTQAFVYDREDGLQDIGYVTIK